MEKHSLAAFLKETAQKEEKNGFFELENKYLLELNLNNQSVFIKRGAMVAYDGEIKYKREGLFNKGVGNLLKKAVSGEGTSSMEASGTGRIYVADCAKKVHILHLGNESININGNDVLAYEKELKYDIKLMKSIGGIMGGGLFQVHFYGTGYVAITTHGDPITLRDRKSVV